MRNSGFLWVIVAIMLLLDIYVFQAVKVITHQWLPKWRISVYAIYWTISVLTLVLLMLWPYLQPDSWPKTLRSYALATLVGLFFAKLLAATFFLLDDVRRGMMWMVGKLFSNPSVEISQADNGITRSAFLSWLGLAAGTTLFSSLMYGFRNKYRYDVRRVRMNFPHLPEAFNGMRIAHISDIHSGSFNDKPAVQHGVDMLLKEQTDLILFTGDLVNDKATEMDDYIEIFSQLKAPMGVYSTLGNHDYGDYVQWASKEVKHANLEKLKGVHAQMGWRLLMNEHVVLEKNGDQIALLGIENWSAKGNFPKYGNMQLAHAGTEAFPFKILMSHDPSHWEGEVLSKYPTIDLMLSGHTHGMQFGVELPGFKWSPVQYMYRQWAGMYEKHHQKLYVNRGFGFIGYPGRVGILPEITIIELVKA